MMGNEKSQHEKYTNMELHFRFLSRITHLFIYLFVGGIATSRRCMVSSLELTDGSIIFDRPGPKTDYHTTICKVVGSQDIPDFSDKDTYINCHKWKLLLNYAARVKGLQPQ